MGCNEMKEGEYPELLFFFESGNDQQKHYCVNFKDNCKPSKTIKFQIKSGQNFPFSIQLKIKSNPEPIKIQESFDDSPQAMEEALNTVYTILNGN